MAPGKFKITIHMVSSVDGFIAKKDNSTSWFETADHYEKGITQQDTESFLKRIDCYVMGSNTYEHAWELAKNYDWVYGNTHTIVVTKRKFVSDRNNIEFYNGDLKKLVEEQLKPRFKNVWVVGGAELVKNFIRLKLVNDIRLSVLPIILGEGLLFFNQVKTETALHLKEVAAYKNGMIDLWYEIKNDRN